jgi:hypothetical protein
LDGERFDPKFLQIKAKRAEHKEVVEKMKQKKEDLEKKKTLKKIKRGEIQAEDVDQEVLADADQFERKKKKSKSEKEEKKAKKEEKKKRKEERAAKKSSKGEDAEGDEDEEKKVKKSKKDGSSTDKEDRKSKKRSRDDNVESEGTTGAGPRKKSTLSSVFKGNGPRPLAALAPPTSDADGDVEMDDAEAKAAKAELNRIRKETRKAAKKEAKKEKAAELVLKKKAARSNKEVKEPTTLEEDGFFSKPTEEEVKTKKAKIEKAIAAAAPAPAASVKAAPASKVEEVLMPARVLDPAEAAKARSGVVAVVDKSAQLAKKNKKPKFDISALEETSDAFGGGQVSGWD